MKNKIAAIVCLMGMCVIGASMPALANTNITYGTGQIEVDNVGTQQTAFKAYMVFHANKNADGTMSNFAWPSNAVRDAVVGIIKTSDPTYNSLNAQDAADYMSRAYQNALGQLTTDQTTILNNAELLNKIAAAIDDTAVTENLSAGVPTALDEGYWLIVTDGRSVETDEDGTSPIFAISSGGLVTINEKTTVPTVSKQILNDADGAVWMNGADAQKGQSIQHKVTGSVAANIRTYEHYYYEFEDVMGKGIAYEMGSFKVMLDGKNVTSSFTEKLTSGENGKHKLSIACSDIMGITGVVPSGNTQLILTYNVKLTDECNIGAAGNPNDVRIIYSSNPNTDETSATHVVRDYLYTFELHVEKKDRDTNVSLAGAKFTIQATNPDDSDSNGLYVQDDGRLASTPYEFVTGSDGTFNVAGLDVGTYTLHETKAPSMYQFVNADTIFTIGATYGADGKIATLSNTVSGNADAVAGIDSTNDHVVNADSGSAANVQACLLNVTVGNIEKVKMPLTGQAGIKVMIMIGGAVVIISGALAIVMGMRNRKKIRKENE